MRYVVAAPFIYRPYRDECLDGCRLENVVSIDNTKTNRGVMRSHNLGIDYMREVDADWLICLSMAVRFGEHGGLDFVAALERRAGQAVVSGAGLFGWHLIAFARETVETVGRWDENFYPYGWDDNDYAIRIHKAQPNARWGGVNVDVSDTTMAHSIQFAGVRASAAHHLGYFAKKWGREPHGDPFESFSDRPFASIQRGTLDFPIGYWPEDLDYTRGARWDAPCPGLGLADPDVTIIRPAA